MTASPVSPDPLKPCPFCGYSEDLRPTGSPSVRYAVTCKACGAGTSLTETTPEAAIAKWNRRAVSEGPAAPAPSDEREADVLLTAFQHACETVVVRGDSHLSETTKERAILRNDLRARLLRGIASGEPASPPSSGAQP